MTDILTPSGEYVHGIASHAHAKAQTDQAAKETAPAETTEAALGEVSFGGTGTVTPGS